MANKLTQKRVRELFNYNPETGNLTRRIKDRHFNVGDIAGNKQKSGYLVINIDGKDYRAHQIICVYINGILTTRKNKLKVDHINGIKNDNRLVNLRLTNGSGNQQNKRLQSNNTSGITGVNWVKRCNQWVVGISNNKPIFLGQYTYFIDAVRARHNAELKYGWPQENSTARIYLREYKWNCRFLELCKKISTWAKDPSTKCSAIIVDKNKKIIATSYNGLPTGIFDTNDRLKNRNLKYQLTIHSEINCLLQAKCSVEGFTIYCYPFLSCERCTVAIIQSGIKKVVTCPIQNNLVERWGESVKLSEELYREAGVQLVYINSDDLV